MKLKDPTATYKIFLIKMYVADTHLCNVVGTHCKHPDKTLTTDNKTTKQLFSWEKNKIKILLYLVSKKRYGLVGVIIYWFNMHIGFITRWGWGGKRRNFPTKHVSHCYNH